MVRHNNNVMPCLSPTATVVVYYYICWWWYGTVQLQQWWIMDQLVWCCWHQYGVLYGNNILYVGCNELCIVQYDMINNITYTSYLPPFTADRHNIWWCWYRCQHIDRLDWYDDDDVAIGYDIWYVGCNELHIVGYNNNG